MPQRVLDVLRCRVGGFCKRAEGGHVRKSSAVEAADVKGHRIALHNIPEGLAVAVPFACATGSRAKGAVAALVSGLAEPAGAVLAALVLAPLLTPGLLNGIVAVVAGIMLWVAAAQLLPAAFEPAWRKMGVTGFCVGVLMMILGIAALA